MSEIGTAYVDIRPDWRTFNRRVMAERGALTRQFGRVGSALGARLSQGMATAAKGGAVAAAGGLVYAVKKAADFEGQLSTLGSVSDATGRQMDRFRKQALKAGADTKFSALDAAAAQTELAKGGLGVAQIMRGGLKSALALAAAGELDLADAAQTTVNAMKLFGLSGRDSMRVADGLAMAANRTTADVSDYALALRQGGSAAKAAGLDFTETVAALEALAEIGIKGCYDRETDVLTRDGFKSWAAVGPGDEFATVNPTSGALEYQHATRLIRYRHTGEMYRVTSKHVDLLVTPEHRMWVRRDGQTDFEIIRAQELGDTPVEYQTGELGWEGSARITATRRAASVGWEHYDDEVFCAEVPNGLLIVRRAGHIVVSGNSDAGTSLKAMLMQLASPTAKAKDLMKDLGLSVFDAEGNMKPLTAVSRELRTSLGGLDRQQRLAAASTLVGTDGMRALLAVYDAGPGKLKRYQTELGRQGTAAQVAKRRQDNLKGSLEQLGGSAETLGITVGTAMIPAIRAGADELTGLTNQISRIVTRDDLNLGQKLQRIFDVGRVRADPWIRRIAAAIERADLPRRLAQALSAAVPVIAEAAARAAPVAAGAFVRAWLSADVWGRLAIGAFLISKMGGLSTFRAAGTRAGAAMGAGMAPAVAGGVAKSGLKGRLAGMFRGFGPLLAISVAATFGPELVKQVRGLQGKLRAKADSNLVQTTKAPAAGNTRKEIALIDERIKAYERSISTLTRHDAATNRNRKRQQELVAELKRERDELGKQLAPVDRAAAAQRQAGRVSDQFARNIRGLRVRGSKDFDALVKTVVFGSRNILRVGGEKSAATRKEVSRQFDLARKRVQEAMDRKVISVKEGSERLRELARKELKLYGISAGRVNVVLAEGAKSSGGQQRPHQRGGPITDGKPTGDSVPAVLEKGEYVLNRRAVQTVGRHVLDQVNFQQAPRFQRGGPVAPKGGFPDAAGALPGLDALGWVLGQKFGLRVTSGLRPGAITTSGNPSDHGWGGAIDISNGITTPQMDAAHAYVRQVLGAGGGWRENYQGGAIKQMLYRTNIGGDHFNHLHIALVEAFARSAAAVMRAVGKGGMAGLGMFNELPRPRLQGPASVALEAGQGALDRMWQAANARLEQVAAPIGPGGGGGTHPDLPGGTLDKGQLAMLAGRAGMPSSNVMAAIAMAESSGNPAANGPPDGRGLWQIEWPIWAARMSQAGLTNAYDPWQNAQMAKIVLDEQGLGAWVVYNTGAYRQFLQRGGLVAGLAQMAAGGSADKRKPGRGVTPKKKIAGLVRGYLERGPSLRDTLKQVRTGKTRKVRREAVQAMVKKVRGIGLPAGLQRSLGDLAERSNVYGEYADRAGSLTVEQTDEEGNPIDPILGQVNGGTQLQWLTRQLSSLLGWRNAMIHAERIVLQRRAQVQKTLAAAKRQLAAITRQIRQNMRHRRNLEKQLERARKQIAKIRDEGLGGRKGRKRRRRDRARKIEALRGEAKLLTERIQGVDRHVQIRGRLKAAIKEKIIPALTGQSQGLSAAREEMLGNLEGVQGVGAPMNVMGSLPPIGTLGGQIFDVQTRIRELTTKPPPIKAQDTDTSEDSEDTDTSGDTRDSERAGLLEELLRQANLRTAVSERQFQVLKNMPPYGGSFATGGVVPGPAGQARTIVAHGGETILTADQDAGPRVRVLVQDERVRVYVDDVEQIVDRRLRQTARHGSRGLPGRGGGLVR